MHQRNEATLFSGASTEPHYLYGVPILVCSIPLLAFSLWVTDSVKAKGRPKKQSLLYLVRLTEWILSPSPPIWSVIRDVFKGYIWPQIMIIVFMNLCQMYQCFADCRVVALWVGVGCGAGKWGGWGWGEGGEVGSLGQVWTTSLLFNFLPQMMMPMMLPGIKHPSLMLLLVRALCNLLDIFPKKSALCKLQVVVKV